MEPSEDKPDSETTEAEKRKGSDEVEDGGETVPGSSEASVVKLETSVERPADSSEIMKEQSEASKDASQSETSKEFDASEAVKDSIQKSSSSVLQPASLKPSQLAASKSGESPTTGPPSPKPARKSTGSESTKRSKKSIGSESPKPVSRSTGSGSPKLARRSTGSESPKTARRSTGSFSPKPARKSTSSQSPKPARKSSGSESPKPTKKSSGLESPRSKELHQTGSSKSPKPGSGRRSSIKSSRKGKKSRSTINGKAADTSLGLADQVLPEGAVPIFLAVKTQELFGLRTDEDITVGSSCKYIQKEDVLKDLHNRAAVCDFHPIKHLLIDYPGEEFLLVYDPEFKHGQNFIIATTEEAKLLLLKELEDEELEEEEEMVQSYVPPVAKAWVSYGSEKEVEEELVIAKRKNISVQVIRPRREFGAPTNFSDRNAANVKDGYVECRPYEDKAFNLTKVLQDKGTQSVSETVASAAQTEFKWPKNASAQTEPREYTEEEKMEKENSPEMANFIKAVATRMESTLQQNEIMNVFYDDWTSLTSEDGSFGSKADNHLKEFQSFTDLQFSKARTITCIDWHPTIKGVVAVSVGERMSFDDRIDNMHKTILTPSLILIWSFTDPIHPQLLLEAPDDILCFKFCPTEPNYVAGGCLSGQVVLWDISQHSSRLRQARAGKTKDPLNGLVGFEDDSALNTPIIRYCAVSSIEHSHQFPVTDLLWVPDHFEVNRMGVPQENRSGQCCQIMTCATDHVVLFWDIRAPKTIHQASVSDKQGPRGMSTTFRHLDLVWKPHLKVSLSKSDPGGDHAPTKFSIAERQGDRSSLLLEEEEEKKGEVKATETGAGAFAYGSVRTAAASFKRTLANIKTLFYVGTEDGELVYVDWMPQKDHESGRIQTSKPLYYHSIHDGPIVTLQRSPFFRDVILCVGGWMFSIWQEGVATSPILRSAASAKHLTGGHWSPSRPAVFYITKQDGSVDIWDLLDRTHEPCMNQTVSSVPITCIYPFQVTAKQHLLAVGDAIGTLHILAIPWSLRQPTANELTGMANYVEREVKRRAFVMSRWDFREKEKVELDAEAKRKAGIAPQVVLTDEEVEHRMRLDYQAYLDEEAAFLRQLGLADELSTTGKIPVPIEANG